MTHEVFDRNLIRARRRMVALRDGDLDFLERHVAEDLALRVGGILREFQTCVDIGAHRGHVASALAGLENVSQIIELEWAPELLLRLPGAPGADCLRVCADEEYLPIKSQSVDLITSSLVLQHVNDLPGSLVQIKLALKPDGLFLGVLPGGQTLHELRTSFMMAEMEIDGGSSPRVAPFADVRAMGGLMQRAGFALPVVDSDLLTITYADPLALMKELGDMGWANALHERRKSFLGRALLMRATEIYIAEFGLDNGRVPASFELITLTGWSPDASQQQPLRPGSATGRLADALGATEISTGEKAGYRGDD